MHELCLANYTWMIYLSFSERDVAFHDHENWNSAKESEPKFQNIKNTLLFISPSEIMVLILIYGCQNHFDWCQIQQVLLSYFCTECIFDLKRICIRYVCQFLWNVGVFSVIWKSNRIILHLSNWRSFFLSEWCTLIMLNKTRHGNWNWFGKMSR